MGFAKTNIDKWIDNNFDKLTQYTRYVLEDNPDYIDDAQDLYSELEASIEKELNAHYKFALRIIGTGIRRVIKVRSRGKPKRMNEL